MTPAAHRPWSIASLKILGAASAVGIVGCSSTGTAAPSASSEPDRVSLVVIGDSIPYNSSDDCPGCTGFVDGYAEALAEGEGADVAVANLSRHDGAQTRDILDQVSSGGLDSELGGADIVVISSGYNDQPPYWRPEDPCYAEVQTDDDAIDAAIATTPECIVERTAAVRASYAELLAEVTRRAPGAEVVALTAYNSWAGWGALHARGEAVAGQVNATIVDALEQWRDVVCEEAAQAEASCLDLLEPFNGPSGDQPAGDLLAADYTHPSQAGNDLIRDLLLDR